LKFSLMEPAYRDNKSLPEDIAKWIRDQNKVEDDFNANLPALNAQRAEEGKDPLKRMGHSTSCCMQASLSFNASGAPIPKAGSRDRDNTTLAGGKHYILAVDDYRCISRRAQSDMQNGSILRDINLLASKHRIDPRSQAGFLCQLKQELEGFIRDAILRVIKVETHRLGGQALAALRVIGK